MINHVCADHVIHPRTETLIVGTFNPKMPGNCAEFFYGRPRNSMWTILARAYGVEDLKKKSKVEKLDFLHTYRVDFVDLISEVGEPPQNFEDRALEKLSNIRWNDVINEIAKLSFLKRVCISRKGFQDVPEIRKRVKMIELFLADRRIIFRCLHTPARAYKRAWPEWSGFLKETYQVAG